VLGGSGTDQSNQPTGHLDSRPLRSLKNCQEPQRLHFLPTQLLNDFLLIDEQPQSIQSQLVCSAAHISRFSPRLPDCLALRSLTLDQELPCAYGAGSGLHRVAS
jgi:hypothetical protein